MYDKPLSTDKHEAFAQAAVRLNNYSAAWREVYGDGGTASYRTSWVEGCRLAGSIHIGRRIDWLRAQILDRAQISVAALMQDLHDIARADPSELTRMVVVNCRHCHGINYEYQWTDSDEYADACEAIEAENVVRAAARQRPKPPPSFDGGVGFDAHGEPAPTCPHCLGLGRREVWVADTTQISERARKLFKGVKQKADGSIEILMHDQLAARDQLHKLAGAYKTDSNGATLTPPVAQPDAAGKAADPAQSYLALIHGTRAA